MNGGNSYIELMYGSRRKSSFVRSILVTMMYYFILRFPRQTVQKVPRVPGLRKNAKPINLPNCPSYLQGSSEHTERLDRYEFDNRHFLQALELSRAEHKKENDNFSVSDNDEIQRKYSILNLFDKWMYIRSSQTILHIFKRIHTGPLLIMLTRSLLTLL